MEKTEESFVEEIFRLAESEEIEKLAQERFAEFKANYQMKELKESEIFNVLSAAYIADRFFGKSRSWISQKLNHHVKNGKEISFTPEEYATLKKAIETIALELQALADEM